MSILETKKIITEIKNNSIKLSSKDFDDGNIDAFAHNIWNNFNHYYNLISKIGNKQLTIIELYIDNKNNYIKNENFLKIFGEKNNLEKITEKEKKEKIKLFNFFKCKNENSIINEYNVVEHSTTSKIKIKINKLIWIRIYILFFLIEDKDIFLEKLTNLFETFPSAYNITYKLNEEEIKSFVYLIWNNFSNYYDISKKLENNESIRITSYTGYPEGYWSAENFNEYNEITNKNNDVIDWTTFNNRTKDKKETKLFKHDQDFDIFNRKKKIDGSDPQPGPSWKNLLHINLKDIITNTFGFNLEDLPNLTEKNIKDILYHNNLLLDKNQISIDIDKKKLLLKLIQYKIQNIKAVF
ncbi:hypothetical protein [Spiroplasma endosymbiont of Colias croceus]|uniref:hypothetical protein n=1 Tax=Spiroplasma endosymbiont of Colias croceus TaxID=3066310 RepID=UPI0030CB66EE